MSATNFQTWNPETKIRMPKLERPAEGWCPKCNSKMAITDGKVPAHKAPGYLVTNCPGTGAVATPIAAKGGRR